MMNKSNWKNIKRVCSRRNFSSTHSPEALSVLYSSWSKLPSDEKPFYPKLQSEFHKNSVSIRSVLKRQSQKKPIILRPSEKNNPILDLREKYRIFRERSATIKQNPALKNFIFSLGRNVQSGLFKTAPKNPISTVIRNSIYETYIPQDEPQQSIREAEMNRIPYKEKLTLSASYGEIYISGIKAASDSAKLIRNNIIAIVYIGDGKHISQLICITGGYQILNIKETESKLINFTESLNKSFRFLDCKLREGNVLIACYYGICRSCAVVAAFVMKKYKVRLDIAMHIVKSGRKVCNLSEPAIEILKEMNSFNLQVHLFF